MTKKLNLEQPITEDPRVGTSLHVVIFLVDGCVNDVKLFTVLRPARQYVRSILQQNGDEDNWSDELINDNLLIYTHTNKNEEVIIKCTAIQSYDGPKGVK